MQYFIIQDPYWCISAQCKVGQSIHAGPEVVSELMKDVTCFRTFFHDFQCLTSYSCAFESAIETLTLVSLFSFFLRSPSEKQIINVTKGIFAFVYVDASLEQACVLQSRGSKL